MALARRGLCSGPQFLPASLCDLGKPPPRPTPSLHLYREQLATHNRGDSPEKKTPLSSAAPVGTQEGFWVLSCSL